MLTNNDGKRAKKFSFFHENTLPLEKESVSFAVELLPGQYDQREDFAEQCIQLITQKERPVVAAAKVYVLEGNLTTADIVKIKKYCINPVEAREAAARIPETLEGVWENPKPVEILTKFNEMTKTEIDDFRIKCGLAMSLDDLCFCQSYFKAENRSPSITEIKVLDTYWSDHCRHTTFMTQIQEVKVADSLFTNPVQKAYEIYQKDRLFVYGKKTDRPITLMDIAVLGMEFKLREADFGIYPKGLIYGLSCLENWLYGGDPVDALQVNALLKFLREKLKTNYFESLIENYLLDNTHKLLLTLRPEPGKEERQHSEELAKMAALKNTMSTEEVALHINQAKKLHE